MSVNYDLYETSNPDKEGEVLPLHARVLLKGSYTAEEFADQVVAFQHMPHAQVVGIIEAISKELQHLLLKEEAGLEGYVVREAYRSISDQQTLWDAEYNRLKGRHSAWTDDEIGRAHV